MREEERVAALEDNFDLAISKSAQGRELTSRRLEILSRHGLENWEGRVEEEVRECEEERNIEYFARCF